ncbi:hypothetical protein [Haloplanus sp.]|uniref:hypothetical protein n=1 Tax=Haloplanus sp. TaxID=1961696 RepID=UPI00261BACD4|nr:hypothetical protein [Haloplanus sp.]
MHRSIRYVVALLVGVGLAVAAGVLSDTHGLPLISIAVVYTATTVLVLAHRNDWAGLSGKTTGTSRRVGAIGGGVGAFAGATLLQVSIPVGVTGLGLYLFGMAVVVADVSPVSDG